MPQAQQNKNYFTFVKGLITEANPLTYPEDTSFDEDNFILKRNGSRERRLGIDWETNNKTANTVDVVTTIGGSSFDDSEIESYAFTTHEWRGVAGDGNKNYTILQIGPYLYVHDMERYPSDSTDNHIISENRIDLNISGNEYIDLTNYAAPGLASSVGTNPVDIAFGRGRAFITCACVEPIYLEYTTATDTWSVVQFELQVRDFEGVTDNLDLGERPSYLSKEHQYNLLNQGWKNEGEGGIDTRKMSPLEDIGAVSEVTVTNGGSGYTTEPTIAFTGGAGADAAATATILNGEVISITVTEGGTGYTSAPTMSFSGGGGSGATATCDYATANDTPSKYPSNSDLWQLGKYTDLDTASSTNGQDIWNTTQLDKFNIGNATAAKGSFTYDLFNINRSSNVAGLSDITETYRASTVAFFAGRVWYSGFNSERIGGNVVFSQIIQNIDQQVGYCFQANDPTAEDLNEVLPSDGGVIDIPEVGHVNKIITAGNSLIILANNGVWQISGGDSGFTADTYVVKKVTNVGCDSPNSVIFAEGLVFYWAGGGIYVLEADQISLNLKATNITQNTIQTKYNNIPRNKKNKVFSIYDENEKVLIWGYNDDAGEDIDYKYTKSIMYDLNLKAFHLHSLGTLNGDKPFIATGLFYHDLTVGGVQQKSTPKFLSIVPTVPTHATDKQWKYCFSYMKDGDYFTDWRQFEIDINSATDDAVAGHSYTSYLETAYELGGDAMRNKQVNYLYIYMTRTELTATDGVLDNQSAVDVQARWEWADDSISGKFTDTFDGYKYVRPYVLSSTTGTVNVDYGYKVMVTKNKIRGQGKAVQFRFASQDNKDCKLLGWAIHATGVTIV